MASHSNRLIRTPKILPWLARRAGVPIDRAEALWQDAVRETDRAGIAAESSDYWKATVNRLMAKLAAESQRRRAAPFGFGPLLHLPVRLALIGLAANEAYALAAARNWRPARTHHCRAC